MNTSTDTLTTRIFRALGWAIYGAIGGALVSVLICLVIGSFSLFYLFGGVIAALFGIYAFFKAPNVGPYEGRTDSREAMDEHQRRLWGKAQGDAVSKPGAINDDDTL